MEKIDTISKYCTLKKLNYERLLCSLLCFCRSMEGMLYDFMQKVTEEKNKAYSKLPVQNINQIYSIVDASILSEYTYNKKTRIQVMNCIDETSDFLTLSEAETAQINGVHSVLQGSYIYNKKVNKKNI